MMMMITLRPPLPLTEISNDLPLGAGVWIISGIHNLSIVFKGIDHTTGWCLHTCNAHLGKIDSSMK